MDAKEHNAQVLQVARKMPDTLLMKAWLAFGARLPYGSTVLSGWSLGEIAKYTVRRDHYGGRHPIDRSQLSLALRIFEAAGLVTVHHVRHGRRNGRSEYTIDTFDHGTAFYSTLAADLAKVRQAKAEKVRFARQRQREIDDLGWCPACGHFDPLRECGRVVNG
jgi:hypothetical protein